MANVCYFNGIIKGEEINCRKFLDCLWCDDIIDSKECTTEDDEIYECVFFGTCAWDIDANADKTITDVNPLSKEEIESIDEENGLEKFKKYTLQMRSKLFNVEILCNSIGEDFSQNLYEHYIKGEKIEDDCPNELQIIDSSFNPFKEIFFSNINNSIKKISDRNKIYNILVNDLDSSIVDDIDDSILNDKDFMLKVIQDIHKQCPDGEVLDELLPSMSKSCKIMNDKSFVIEIAKIEGFYTLDNLCESLKDDEEIAKTAIIQNPESFIFLSSKLLNNKNFIQTLNLSKNDIEKIKNAIEDFGIDDEELMKGLEYYEKMVY